MTNSNSGRVLKPSLNENGYLYVSLWQNGKSKSKTIHRIVATVFIPNPCNKPFVNHLDANRSNPHKNNLEWCSQSENIKHAYILGNMSAKRHFESSELDWLLSEVLKNRNMTELASQMNVGLSRLTINLRKRALQKDLHDVFEAMLSSQKRERNAAANSNKHKPITQFNGDGEVIATYPSITAAARALGKTSGSISNALNPSFPQKKAYGYLWKFS